MRLCITLATRQTLRLPTDHYSVLRGVIYRLLGEANRELATFLHDDGYQLPGTPDSRRYKLFAFSQLRVPQSRRILRGDRLEILPSTMEWILASPREDFLRAEITALLSSGGGLELDHQPVEITGLSALPAPDFNRDLRCICLTPIVAAVPSPEGRSTPLYLRPSDGAAFSNAIRSNLLRKYEALHGAPPDDTRLTLTFDAEYLARQRRERPDAKTVGTKLACLDRVQIVGAFAPFVLSGSPALLGVAWTCGLGQRNGSGFGMWDVAGAK